MFYSSLTPGWQVDFAEVLLLDFFSFVGWGSHQCIAHLLGLTFSKYIFPTCGFQAEVRVGFTNDAQCLSCSKETGVIKLVAGC